MESVGGVSLSHGRSQIISPERLHGSLVGFAQYSQGLLLIHGLNIFWSVFKIAISSVNTSVTTGPRTIWDTHVGDMCSLGLERQCLPGKEL